VHGILKWGFLDRKWGFWNDSHGQGSSYVHNAKLKQEPLSKSYRDKSLCYSLTYKRNSISSLTLYTQATISPQVQGWFLFSMLQSTWIRLSASLTSLFIFGKNYETFIGALFFADS
jgi:hypothetical protein